MQVTIQCIDYACGDYAGDNVDYAGGNYAGHYAIHRLCW